MAVQQSSEPGTMGPDTPVRELMTRAVAKISPDARLDEVAQKLSSVEAGAMGVGTGQTVVGIVSERDLTRAFGTAESPATMRVSDIASTDLIWCEPATSAASAAKLMVEKNIRHLLVGDDDSGDLQGIVSARDLMEALVGP